MVTTSSGRAPGRMIKLRDRDLYEGKLVYEIQVDISCNPVVI